MGLYCGGQGCLHRQGGHWRAMGVDPFPPSWWCCPELLDLPCHRKLVELLDGAHVGFFERAVVLSYRAIRLAVHHG